MRGHTGQWILLLGALGFGTLGQFYFAKKPDYFLDGLVFYIVAAICLILLVIPRRAPAPVGVAARRLWSRTEFLRSALIIGSVILGAITVVLLARPQTAYWPIFGCWVVAIGLSLCTFLPRPRWTRPALAAFVRANALELSGIILVVAVAFLLRAWRVDTIPWTLSGDEGNFGRWAREALDGRMTNMFVTGHLSMPSMYIFWQAGWLRIAGDNMVGLRLPWAFMGTLSVLGTYLLIRRLFDIRLAFLTAGLVATYHYHIHYSRLGLNNIADPFFVVWALYFIVVGWQGKRRWPWALSGVLTGLAFYFYTGGRQVPIILAGIFMWAIILEPSFLGKHRTDLGAMLLGFVVTVGPMALFAVQHPDDFNARMNQIGIIQTGWLANEAARLGQTQLQILLDQFQKVFFAFNIYRDRTDFYKPIIPLLDFFPSILFLLGVALSIVQLHDPAAETAAQTGSDRWAKPGWRYAVFVIWFFAAIILGGVLTESAPSSQRIISSSIPVMFFVAVAFRALTRVLGDLLPIPRLARLVLAGLLAFGLAWISVQYYFGPYQQSWIYGSYNAEVSTRIGYYMRDLGPEYKEYFFGAPRMYADFGSSQFIAKGIQVHDVVQPLTRAPDFVDPKYKPVFIFLPERTKELTFIRQAYPNGVQEEVRRINDSVGPLLFTAYRP